MMDEPLSGGNVNAARRVGNTVRRSAGPWTVTVHRLLSHVRHLGVWRVPEPLGFDESGREILGFLPGDVPHQLPAWLWNQSVLCDAAQLLRQWHDATASFQSVDSHWGLVPRTPREVICHNDFAPYNTVFRAGHLVGLIDFDTCAPGPRLWDVAYAAYRFVPLVPGTEELSVEPLSDYSPFQWAKTLARLEQFLTAYAGIDRSLHYSTTDCLQTTAQRLVQLADWSTDHAARLNKPELQAHAEVYRQHSVWLDLQATQPR